ncbi:hypothetical protein ACQ9Y2_23665 [Pseudomonas palleroniana]
MLIWVSHDISYALRYFRHNLVAAVGVSFQKDRIAINENQYRIGCEMAGVEDLDGTDDWKATFANERHTKKLREIELQAALKLQRKQRRIYKTLLILTLSSLFLFMLKLTPDPLGFAESLTNTWAGVILLLLMLSVMLYRIWTVDVTPDSDISFVALDKRVKDEKTTRSATQAQELELMELKLKLEKSEKNHEVVKKTKSRTIAGGFDFVEHMNSIIESLDFQIDYAEEKASLLLESGRRFLKWGIWLYVASIVIWQIYLWYIKFEVNAGVVAGMVSCSVLFLIIEFLGAWFLKQYRHYGDSAFAYMKVRSSYNKYMLAYCAIVEFSGADDDSKAKEDILKVLSAAEQWPELKEINSNDFNYMLQSVDSMGAIFDKLKGVFGRSGNGEKPS